MTCVVALLDRETGHMRMSADLLASDGSAAYPRLDTKVFARGPFLIGFTWSYRMGQLLRYSMDIPSHPADMGDEEYMVTRFIESMRDCLKAGGSATKESDLEKGGVFLVMYRGGLYNVDFDYQIGIPAQEFDAIGCGFQVARGSLYSSRGKPPAVRLKEAILAAATFSVGVGVEMTHISLPIRGERYVKPN